MTRTLSPRRPHRLALAATLVIALLAGLPLAAPRAAHASEAGDAVFAERGPWSLGDKALRWSVTVDGPDVPGFLRVTDGSLEMTEITDPSDGKPVLQLTQKTNDRTRKIGPFPISGGDPALTFFLEQTARDMARLTGGSPFYIRNRIKDSLFRAGDLTRDGDTVTARFQPFADDPNGARMQGFQTLTMTFVIGGPKAPIREMTAETSDPVIGGTANYRQHMVLQ